MFDAKWLSILVIVGSCVWGCADHLAESQYEDPTLVPADEQRAGGVKEFNSNLTGGNVGEQCASGCIWSAWAVSYGAQSGTHFCGGIPCACVADGDINATCTTATQSSAVNTQVDDTATSISAATPTNTASTPSLGDNCGASCLWSGYAVVSGVQSAEATCAGGVPCSCVVVNDIHTKCGAAPAVPQTEPEPEPERTPTTPSGSSPAAQILSRHGSGRITLWNQSFGRFDGADPLSNIRDASAGRAAKTSCYGGAPCNQVWLQPSLLNSVRDLIEKDGLSFFVTAIAGASHSYGSKHYQGRAIDVDEVNGVRINGNSAAAERFMQACRRLGASEVFGPSNDPYGHRDHIHCAW